MVSVEAAQCYDRIAHTMTSLTLCAYNIRQSSVASMLTPLQSMKYYTRTGFGKSTTYLGVERSETRLMPRKHISPVNVAADQLTTDQHPKKTTGHGIAVVFPSTKKSHSQVGILFVDDTNLWEGLGKEDAVIYTLEKGQRSVNSWGSNLLAAEGRRAKTDKCSYTVHRIKMLDTGEYEYVQ